MNKWNSILIAAALIAAALTASSTPAHAETQWLIDSRTNIEFAAPRSATFAVRGSFHGITGSMRFQPGMITSASVEADIPVSTLVTDIKKRDDDLKGPRFFNVQQFALAHFKSKTIKPIKPGKYLMSGTLSMHGVERAVTISFDRPEIKSRPGKPSELTAAGDLLLEPLDFGLDLKNLHPDGFVKLSDKVKLKIKLHASQKNRRSQL